ncbi:MAG TPA: HDOD domain-containing protein [Candidatus Binatia bacterium]|nr:HDOD domain-containing protein [Candidatus Binatia bacterium]
MGTAPVQSTTASAQENVRKYFNDIVANHRLPSLPLVASKVLEMIQDPDIKVQKLCRILSDDAALAGRILAVSRSASYAQRNLPKTLLGAVQVLGFRTLRNVVVASATHSLCIRGNGVSETLWNHSLSVALAMRLLCRRLRTQDEEQAFLAGLLHDVGETILLHGDPIGFAKLAAEVQRTGCQMIDKEQEAYGFDHTLIGLTLLDAWNIDSQIGRAVLNHHSDVTGDDANQMAGMIAVADYLSCKADLGFFAEAPSPAAAILAECCCDGDEALAETVEAIRSAFQEESALFRPV